MRGADQGTVRVPHPWQYPMEETGMTFKDIFKSSFIENVTSFSAKPSLRKELS
jgi:hypothetical protein